MTRTDPHLIDTAALRRRVLLTGVVALVLFVAVSVALLSSGLPDWMVLPAAVLLYVLVVRPMMQPVRDAVRLRRDVAYQAFFDQKGGGRGGR
ncbi:MAG: hypothetical protein JWN08_2951 [Frankiales bacterium]|nr:hypothetical protein [Frankiales bacterium]